MFRLPPLPYAPNALEPYISERTVRLHHGVHQAGYLNTLNAMLETPSVRKVLRHLPTRDMGALAHLISALDPNSEDPIELAAYRNASQAWNHYFYWESMRPPSQKKRTPGTQFDEMVQIQEAALLLLNDIAKQGVDPAPWFWFIIDDDGDVAIRLIDGVDPSFMQGYRPLAVCDGWEHAYYLDYPADRKKYLEVFINHLMNWDFMVANMRHGN